MIIENFAERLFCDLRNAEVKLEKPHYEYNGTRIGNVPNLNQFNIVGLKGKFQFNIGVSSILQLDAFELTYTEAYQLLLNKLIELKHIKFYSMIIPNGSVEHAKLEEFINCTTRYIKQYEVITDEIYERWDVLVQKIMDNNNV
jgi:hypothetical protein